MDIKQTDGTDSGSRNRWCKAYEGFYYTVGKKKNRYGANVNERISDVTG